MARVQHEGTPVEHPRPAHRHPGPARTPAGFPGASTADLGAAAALGVVGTLALIVLWALVGARATDGWDRAVLDAVRLGHDSGSLAAARFVTAFGDGLPLTLAMLAAGVALARLGGRRVALLPGAAALAGWLLSDTFKVAVSRPRPAASGWLVPVSGYAFPSGHTSSTAAGYLTVALLAAHLVTHVVVRRVVVTVAVVVPLLVGVTRVLLGVHWPTDVLGGWALGGAVAFATVLVVQLLAPEGGAR